MRAALCLAVLALGAGAVLGAGPASAAGESLSGTVTSSDGTPLEGVCVELYGPQTFTTVTTDAAGTYTADEIDPGDYLVGFNTCEEPLPGFAAEFYDDAPGFSEASPARVDAGAARTGIDAELEPAAVISGTVTDEDSADPLEGTCVVALEFEIGLFAIDRTDEAGDYELANLRGGEYVVLFNDCSDPFNHIGEAYDEALLGLPIDVGGDSEPTPVAVEDGERVDGIDAALTEGGSVRGSVTALHTGRPANGVCIGLFATDAEEEDFPDSVTGTGFLPDGTSAAGEYVFGGVPPGDYVVGFNPTEVCGDEGYDSSWAAGKESRESADVLTVEQGEVIGDVDAVVAPQPSISAACFDDGSGSPFTDVPDDSVHAPAIDCISSYGIAFGRADGSYGPAELVTRDQMATFIARTLKNLDVDLPADPPDAFTDDVGSVHENAIDQLAALGVVTGKGGGRYAPGEPVSRGQMTAFLVRAYERATEFALLAPQSRFSDDDGTTHEPSIDRAATAGLTAGADDGRFRPGDAVRRDQMATFTARLLDRVQRDLGLGGFLVVVSTETSESETVVAPPGSGLQRARLALGSEARAPR